VNGISGNDLTDNNRLPLTPVVSCASLESEFLLVDIRGRNLCRTNADADLPCPPSTYGVLLVPDANTALQQATAFKVCSLCPAGERWPWASAGRELQLEL